MDSAQTTQSGGDAASPALGTFGIDMDAMDASVRPGDDFYSFVNGRWLATYELPPDKARYGAFDKSEADVHAILLDLTATAPAEGTTERKVADLFSAWMDTDTIEARGIEPLRPYLDDIAAVRTTADLWPLFGGLDHAAPFGAGIGIDPADSTRYCVGIGQSGLGMPNRDFYSRPGRRSDEYRAAYRTLVTRLFELIGDADPAASAAQVIELETAIAEGHWTPERRRIVKETVNPMDRAGLARLAPDIDWDAVLGTLGLGAVERVVVRETTAVTSAGRLIAERPLEDWKKYLTFHVVRINAERLPAAFDQAVFDFYWKVLRGTEAQRSRWQRGVGLVNHMLGEGVSQVYVERHFPPGHKAAMDDLVANVRKALAQRIESLAWMDEPTRAEAQSKLAAFEPRVGYPARWRDYSSLTITPGKLFESVRAARAFEWNREVARLHEPVDRGEWALSAQTVNAYYDPTKNQITFPAAILQAPFFDPHADPAVNYGGIGAVIGHEIGHGFDDQGKEYDGAGNVRNWWTPATDALFKTATDRLAAQFDAIEPLPGLNVNGRLTMGENIGDLGGVEIALTAYRLSLGGAEPPVIDGFTGEQRFFMSWAQVWRATQRPDALRNQILTDPHSPASVRGAVPLQNVDAWYDAFGVREGDAMYVAPDERVRIW